MRIIIVGLGKVGSALAAQLSSEGHNITVVDTDAALVEDCSSRLDIMGTVGNGTSYNTLLEAGIKDADVLVAVTEMDEMNLLCCLIAKHAGSRNTIARVRNPVYSKETGFLKAQLGISMIVNPELAASRAISRLLRLPLAIEIDTFARGRVEMLSFRVADDCVLDGVRIADLNRTLQTDVLICAVERKNEIFIPSGKFVLAAQDNVSIIASPKNALIFFEKIHVETGRVRDTMIVGGSRIGYYLARQLLQMGIAVKIIERDPVRCEELSELLPKANIIYGDGIDKETLHEEGIVDAESFVALTDMDEENIMLSLYCKSVSRAKTVTKINRITFDEVIDSLDLGSIIIPKNITTESILQYVRSLQNTIGSNVETLYKILGGRAEALEFNVAEGCELAGVPLMKMALKTNLLIGCINRNGSVVIPFGQDSFQVGDTVVVVTTNQGLDELSDILL